MASHWYHIADIDQLDSPALVVFSDRVKANIQTAISIVGDVDRLRPHVKTNKSPDVCKLMLTAGIMKFKCATIAEAEMLAMIGAPDIMLAYQPLGPKLERFITLIQKYPRSQFSCLTDNIHAATEQGSAFEKNNLTASLFIDLNVGMNRTGIDPGPGAVALAKFCNETKGINFAGLHAYDGHLRDADLAIRKKECDASYEKVEWLIKELSGIGISVACIVAGGSPSFPIHAKRPNVECSPGTFVYWDKGYLNNCPEQNFLSAAVLVTRVVSLPRLSRVCTDLGHKSVAAENDIERRIFFLNAENLHPVSQSEEHLVCEVTGNNNYSPGDVLYGIPFHICPTVALYERVYIIENGRIAGEWRTTARDRKINV